jgi:hypothetical protein
MSDYGLVVPMLEPDQGRGNGPIGSYESLKVTGLLNCRGGLP